MLELQNGGADATVIDLPVGSILQSTQTSDQHIKFTGISKYKGIFGALAINKDNNKDLQERISKSNCRYELMVNLIHYIKKWFNVDAPADMPVVVEFKYWERSWFNWGVNCGW